MKIPKEMPSKAAAIARMGILNAYLLLETNIQYVRAGEWIIVNAATSVVSHFLVQMARLKGINVISVIREREDAEREKRSLQRHGVNAVLEDEELNDTAILEGKSIKLAFDAVFGEVGQRMLNTLGPESNYVAYGLLGGVGPDVHVKATQELIWLKNITFKRFRFSAALAATKGEEQESLLALFSDHYQKGILTMPLLDEVKWDLKASGADVLNDAIKRARQPRVGQHKMILDFA